MPHQSRQSSASAASLFRVSGNRSVLDRCLVGEKMSYPPVTIMAPRRRCYFTPVLWEQQPPEEEDYVEEWRLLRERFAQARQGRFKALDDVLEILFRLRGADTQLFAINLLGDAGTDEQVDRKE